MQEGKLWIRVHLGKSGLKPLLGTYKGRDGDYEKLPDDDLAIGSNQISWDRLPPIEGPADIEFLRNKFGWCMPTTEQVVNSQKLTGGPKNYITRQRPTAIPSIVASSKSLTSTQNQRLRLFWQKHHFSSKTSDQMEREKLMAKITEELREYEKHQAYLAVLNSRKSSEPISTEPKKLSKFRHRASSLVRHTEIRTKEVFKISHRATTSFKTHLVIMEKRLSLQSKNDNELTKTVRSKIDKSKSVDRTVKLTKISKLESQRKKFGNLHEIVVPPKLASSSENTDEDYFQDV